MVKSQQIFARVPETCQKNGPGSGPSGPQTSSKTCYTPTQSESSANITPLTSHCIGDSGETDDVTAHGTVSVTTTSGALTTNGDISWANTSWNYWKGVDNLVW